MTSGWSKGKKKYYLYYGCTKHRSVNIPASKLHNDWKEILSLLSYSPVQIERIRNESKKGIEAALKNIAEEVGTMKRQLSELNSKIERLEEKMMNDEIEPYTYKKWFNKYAREKAYLDNEIMKLNADEKGRWKKGLALLDHLIDVPSFFEETEILDQHSLLREVFKHNITYSDGKCRTPTINPGFAHNYLKIKQKKPSRFRAGS